MESFGFVCLFYIGEKGCMAGSMLRSLKETNSVFVGRSYVSLVYGIS